MNRTQRNCLAFAVLLAVLVEQSYAVRVGGGGAKKKGVAADQSTSASWWTADAVHPSVGTDTDDFFQSTHGLLQTHPAVGGGPIRYTAGSPGKKTSLNGGLGLKHLDYRNSATAELRNNPSLSTPDECARACREGEPPRVCYYHFTLEHYTVLGAACQVCTPNATNTVWSNCQCVLADGVERGILTANRWCPVPVFKFAKATKS